VPLVNDQETVREFAADGADEALRDRIGPRRSHRRLEYVDSGSVEGGSELGSGGLRGPAAGDELAVPAQDRGRGDEQAEATAYG
jgi:hypothetical protein